ncbi:MAG TPA: tetratricopeptide repeat protein [Acidimicrobiales bacterium]|nr:tetratricopeptide repeat protein [Acidimicrobiales bacterium]
MSTPSLLQSEHDEHRNPMSGPAEAVALYDRAIDRMLRYHPEVVDLATTLAEEHADVPMTGALLAYLHLTSTDEPDVAVAAGALEGMAAIPMNEREQAHHEAIAAWVGGDWIGASRILDQLLVRWPTDLLALQVGHLLDFSVGDAANLRDRPGRSLLALDPDHPHTAVVRGMHAFGLEESGSYAEAEEAGLAAVAVNRDDVWAIHAVVHTHEMRGRVADGIRFLRASEADWGSGNLFTVHNWWHLALFHLEGGDIDDVLRIYDAEVHHAASQGVPLEMLDASALLWRLRLDGVSDGGRFAPLADAWATRTDGRPWYVFNDLHAVMALVGAGRIADAEGVVERLAGYVHCGGSGTNVAMTAEIGLPASRAIIRFAQERYADVIDELLPIRRVLQRFGGSHAQRDVLQRTLLEAALRAGQHDLARALLSERLAVRETSVYGWTQQARLYEALGRPADAAAAAEGAAASRALARVS